MNYVVFKVYGKYWLEVIDSVQHIRSNEETDETTYIKVL